MLHANIVFLAALCGIALIPVLQLIPLSTALWVQLPGRNIVAETYAALGQELPSLPMSLTPLATGLSALSLLSPFGIFLGCLLLNYQQRRTIGLLIVGIALLSVLVGFLQLAQGPNSPLRFFAFTNTTEAVGFFANRNHLAALLYAAMLLVVSWAVDAAATAKGQGKNKTFETTAVAALMIAFTALIALVMAQAMARSRAGLILTMVALIGAVGMTLTDRRTAKFGASSAKYILAAAAFAVVLSMQFALYRILSRFSVDPLADARIPFAKNTFEAAKNYMPFGSGVGSFVPVYGMLEKPGDMFQVYANHAHNDFLEVWLETGVVGLVFIAIFALWLLLRSIRVWRLTPGRDFGELDIALMKAATLILALLGLHSLVDYPLRTGAIMAVAAFACASLMPPRGTGNATDASDGSREQRREPDFESALHRMEAASETRLSANPSHEHLGHAPASAKIATGQRWGDDIEWPETWRAKACGATIKMRGQRQSG